MRTTSWTSEVLRWSALVLLALALVGAKGTCDEDPALEDPEGGEAAGEAPAGDPTGEPAEGGKLAHERGEDDAEGGKLAEDEEPIGGKVTDEPADRDHPGTASGGHPLGVIGTWRSEACGERTYPREITLDGDGIYVGFDLISPCPKGARCIWSGILKYRGTWLVDGDVLTLDEEGLVGDGADQGVAPPPSLGQLDGGSRLVETGREDCVYDKTEPRGTAAYRKGDATPR